jgi:hypothetical protein
VRNITVGFSKSRKKFPIGSWTIRLYQGFSAFSHCYIRLKMDNAYYESDKLLHASEGKVQAMSGTQFDKRHCVVEEFTIHVPDWLYVEVVKELHEASGDDYSILQNLGIFVVDVARIFGIKMHNPWISGWNCSEFVAVVLLQILPDEFAGIDPNTITPKQVNRILKDLAKSGVIKVH